MTVEIELGFTPISRLVIDEFCDTCKVELYNRETNELVEETASITLAYFYEGLDAGEYKVNATAKGFAVKERSVTIEENSDKTIKIIFERSDMSKVKLRTLFDLPMLQRILIKLLNLQ